QDHRNAAAHRPRANNRGGIDGNNRSVFRNVRNFGNFALAKENMNERLRLIRKKALHEELALEFDTFFEWKLRGGFHCIDCSKRCDQTALLFASILARCGKN